MRYLVFVSIFFLGSAPVFAQKYLGYGKTKADYERVTANFIRFYNKGQVDSIHNILSDTWSPEDKNRNWNADLISKIKESMGEVVSFRYIDTFNHQTDINSNPMVYFKMVFSKPSVSYHPEIKGKKIHPMCISLDKDGKIFAFSFVVPNTQALDSLMSKY